MIVMHIDANSAYLSWTAVNMLKNGETTDIREIASAIGGDPESRHGIILAKSVSAKRAGVVTGESIFEAKRKCPDLQLFPPDHDLYARYSDAMFEILYQYSPVIQRASVDECYLDYTGCEKVFGDPVKCAYEIKDRIKRELGFTVNIGVSTNKLLAKMGSELKKPDRVHTLFPEEVPEKLWPLPIEELYMVGRATAKKLRKININTIGDLAQTDRNLIKTILKSHGATVWDYANGIDSSPVVPNEYTPQKGIGNSVTVSRDIKTREDALKVLLAMTDKVASRLRRREKFAAVIAINLTNKEFRKYGHQSKLSRATDSTSEIFDHVTRLFDECWRGEPLRLLGVSVTEFYEDCQYNMSFFEDNAPIEENRAVDEAVDTIRKKFGQNALVRGALMKKK